MGLGCGVPGSQMDKTIQDIIASAKQKDINQRANMEEAIGEVSDALRGFIDISLEWKTQLDNIVKLDPDWARRSHFAARAISLGVLTNKILVTASEIPKVLMSGALTSTVVDWRCVVEAKNIAIMIDLDVVGPMGFLWLNYGMIEQAKVDGGGKDSQRIAEQAKQILREAGFEYDGRSREPWAKIGEKRYSNSIARSEYVWRFRKFPPEVSTQLRDEMATAEQRMIRASNMFAHPTLAPEEILRNKLRPMLLSTVLDPMAVMLAYKVATSELVGWNETRTVGEQFHVYPTNSGDVRDISFAVKEMYDHCFMVFRKHFLR